MDGYFAETRHFLHGQRLAGRSGIVDFIGANNDSFRPPILEHL